MPWSSVSWQCSIREQVLPCGAWVPCYSEAGLETGKGMLLWFPSVLGLAVRKKKQQKPCSSCFVQFGCFVGVLLTISPTKEELKKKKKAKTPQSFECSDIYYVYIWEIILLWKWNRKSQLLKSMQNCVLSEHTFCHLVTRRNYTDQLPMW